MELGTTPRQLTFEGVNLFPMFSPDGNRIAFMSNLDGTDGFDLFVKTLDDDQPARSIITLNGNQRPSQWPSDTLIVFEHSSGGGAAADLWMLDLSDPDNAVAVEPRFKGSSQQHRVEGGFLRPRFHWTIDWRGRRGPDRGGS